MSDKVWIVSVGDSYGSAIHGVFSSEDKANAYIQSLIPAWKSEAVSEKYQLDETDGCPILPEGDE